MMSRWCVLWCCVCVCLLWRPATAEKPNRPSSGSISSRFGVPKSSPISLSFSRPRSTQSESNDGDEDESADEEEEEEDEFFSDALPTTQNRTLSGDYLRRTLRLEEVGVDDEEAQAEREKARKRAPQRVRVDSALRRLLRRFHSAKEREREREREPVRADEDERDASQRSLSRRLTTLSHNLRSLPSATRHVFSQCVYKGVALSFSKSLGVAGGGVGVKIPLTSHFPLYDSNIFLPRVVGFVGVNAPLSYKVAFTFSVPTQAVQTLLLSLSQIDRSLWPKMTATDNVKRVGFTWAAKIPRNGLLFGKRGLGVSHGVVSVFNFVPGARLVQRIVPFLQVTPALMLMSVLYVLAVVAALVPPLQRNLPLPSWERERERERDASLSPQSALSQPSGVLENTLLARFDDAWETLSRALRWKALSLGSTASFTRCAVSVSLNMDFAPFYLLQLKTLFLFVVATLPRECFAACERLVDALNALRSQGERALHMQLPFNRNPSALSFERNMGSYGEQRSLSGVRSVSGTTSRSSGSVGVSSVAEKTPMLAKKD